MFLTSVIRSQNSGCYIDWECLELLFIGRILSEYNLILNFLNKVELSAEDWREDALDGLSLKLVLAILGFGDAEVQDEARYLFNHTFDPASGHDSNRTIIQHDACLDMQAVDLVHALRAVERPVHLLGVLLALTNPIAGLKIKACTFDCQLCVDDEGEYCLLLPVNCDSCSNVMSKGELRRHHPLPLKEAVALTRAILTSS